jgi:hypothetical protein
MPAPLSITRLNERLGLGGDDGRQGQSDAIERAAYAAIGLPHPRECQGGGQLVHHLGTFTIGESEAATIAAVKAVRRERGNGVYDLAEYCNMVASVGGMESRARSERRALETYMNLTPEQRENRPLPADMLTAEENDFRALYSRSEHTPNLAGYLHYLRAKHPDVAAVLDRPLPVYFPDEPRITHTYIIGTTGSGKTELMKLFIHSYVSQPRSAAVVVLDPAGDFAKEICAWPEFNVRSRLIYLRHDLQSGMVPVLNPFELAGTDPLDTSRKGRSALRRRSC